MFQVKEEQNPRKKLMKLETRNISYKEFKTMIVKMLKNLGEEWMNSVRTATKTQKIY